MSVKAGIFANAISLWADALAVGEATVNLGKSALGAGVWAFGGRVALNLVRGAEGVVGQVACVPAAGTEDGRHLGRR